MQRRQRVLLLWLVVDILIIGLAISDDDGACTSDGIPFDLSSGLLLVGIIDFAWSLFWWMKADQVHPLLGKAGYLGYTISLIVLLGSISSDSESESCPRAYPMAILWIVVSSIRVLIELVFLWRHWKSISDLRAGFGTADSRSLPIPGSSSSSSGGGVTLDVIH